MTTGSARSRRWAGEPGADQVGERHGCVVLDEVARIGNLDEVGAEGAGALFRVSTLDLANLPRTPQGGVDFMRDFFGRETFLTVSGQLNVEAYCLALTKVYTFGPTFRAAKF